MRINNPILDGMSFPRSARANPTSKEVVKQTGETTREVVKGVVGASVAITGLAIGANMVKNLTKP